MTKVRMVGGDYGPYIQTQRRDLYPKYAWELVEKGGAYCCFCTKEEIEADRKAAEAKGETYKYNKKCLHNVSLEEAKRRIAAASLMSSARTCRPRQGVLRRHALRPRRGGLRHAG